MVKGDPMNRHRSLKLIALLSLTTLPLGTVACSNGSSPTEPAFLDDQPTVAATSGLSSVTGESRGRGGDDDANDDNGGDNNGGRRRGGDDNTGDDRGGRGRGGRGGRGGQDDNNNPRAGQEFEGTVASVGQNSLTLANGTRIIVNGQTQWIARGDLHSLSEVTRALNANRPTRAEGRGVRQGNGNFVASTIKVEVDD
jgi:hypothetical protein